MDTGVFRLFLSTIKKMKVMMSMNNVCKVTVMLVNILVLMIIMSFGVCAENTPNYGETPKEGENFVPSVSIENLTADTDATNSANVLIDDINYTSDVRNQTMNNTSDVKIRFSVDNMELIVTMYDNPTSRDFVSLLPLQVTMDDFAGAEKISSLPKRLSTEDAPQGCDPSIGDLAYYSPWGNIAMYYRDAEYAGGLIILGQIESGVENLATIQSGIPVNITRMK